MSTSPTSPFPLYLLPSLPFRRRRSSATTTTTTSSTSSPSSSPPHPTSFLSPSPSSHLRCNKCLTDLLPTSSIISKGFTGRHGRAYLVAPPSTTTFDSAGLHAGDLPNTCTDKPVPRQLVTGAHTVCDIRCRGCGSVLGWKYVHAEEEAQKYKVGKYILETRRVVKGVEWEGGREGVLGRQGDAEVEFDSQDEDECEDLFSGIWTPELAGRRRRGRIRRG
ncbi:yippee zinc-binding/DNA-binding /Mis18, centromere assembly-domain-containing protein [Phaeosphaeria sp. MPI-PUGE-AT-0046c]|nr:yippee zinc-binding/DNA-binding /Mis18, centromere assembly-domain-containing protein [Phaeosphaeria sp. MPI-PUGE-AT-0046c]